jgi:hypothetical protein
LPLTVTTIRPGSTPWAIFQCRVTVRLLTHIALAPFAPVVEPFDGAEVGSGGVTEALSLDGPAPDPFTARRSTW